MINDNERSIMISDKTIEESNSKYWCVFKDENTLNLFNDLIEKFKVGQQKIQKEINIDLDDFKDTSSQSMNEGAKKTAGKKIIGWFGKIFTSNPVKKGLQYGTGATMLGGGLYVAGTGAGAGASNAGEGIGDGVFKAKNGGQGISDLAKDPNKQKTLDRYGVSWGSVGLLLGGAAALYALWCCKDGIKSLFTPSKKKKSSKNKEEDIDESEFFLKEEDQQNELSMEAPSPADITVAECQFTADGKNYEVKFNVKTKKWNLTSNGEPVSNEEAKQYFRTNHFKELSSRCYESSRKYLENKDIQRISPELQKCGVFPVEAKAFFKNIVDLKDEILDGLKHGVWENHK